MRFSSVGGLALLATLAECASLISPVNITAPGTTLNYTFSGCWVDGVNGQRSLNAAAYQNGTGMTDESCVAYCYSKGYNYAGTEYSSQCFCDNFIANASTIANNTDCNMACSGNSSEACGGSNRLSVFYNGLPGPSTNPGPGNFSSLGCYNDSNARTLANAVNVPGGATNMTVTNCVNACSASGYTFAGIEYAGECWCDNQINKPGGPISSGCSFVCNGNSSEFCGGSFAMNVYQYNVTKANLLLVAAKSSTTAKTTVAPTSVSTTTKSSTTTTTTTTTTMTTTTTTTTTTTKSSSLTTPSTTTTTVVTTTAPASSTTAAAVSQTTPACPGATGATMIDSNLANYTIYCASDTTVNAFANAGTTSNSWTSCAAQCDAVAGCVAFTYQGAANGAGSGTCWFKNALGSPVQNGNVNLIAGFLNVPGTKTSGSASSTTASPTPTATGPSCPASNNTVITDVNGNNYTMYCATDTSIGSYNNSAATTSFLQCPALCDTSKGCVAWVYAGGANGVGGGTCYFKSTVGSLVMNGNLALVAGILKTSASASTTTTTTTTTAAPISTSGAATTTTTTTTTAAPVPTSLPSGWKYGGCFIDNAYGRILTAGQPGGNSNTVESCVAACVALNYTVAGMEYSSQCYCGNAVIQGGVLASADNQCNMPCSGNANEMCGAGNRMSIYYTGSTLTQIPVPVTQNTTSDGNWKYQGCLLDTGNPRTFPWQLIMPSNNSADSCLSQCAQFGYISGGMEYGDECYCGDPWDITAANATIMPDSGCNVICSGDPAHLCGGGNRISYYTWVGKNPLYVFNYPSGNAAGQYQFLMGGVTVPLMTIQSVTGKVTFLEKSGTGPPNNTGAYELDLAQLQNFTGAWRPMHVKTDIFCSAGITLPDRAGRQLTVGGWSLQSTYGVRLYWPDGQPGVWGTNDWQENVNELSLQNGRWYPSAMIMANGTVLVMGGESGSNAGAVPTLEILPKSGPTVYLDFLNRTNPFNLYPFLAVLPSGGVFTAYYNEARVLDENTFATIKTLPNSPAAVSDFQGGRTYPLEGTAVLMPQYPPYNQPLSIMICGGSTPGAGFALDNCVTIQPEVANPQWVIERMPSKRVISCMTALPDGTYLILNGAMQGQAGFGLGNFPNLNAVLYDPTKPVNQRMSIMANTTVARLYHSEAILLRDGRVMVSGSDPEDNTHPEEYRVEVFIPPYLMGNPVRPSLTNLDTIDWMWGETHTFTTNSSTTPRVSLLGAEASTHGNSMGQRTMFPTVSCQGQKCSVVVPPNAHVMPPGWYQMFVLDGPTPSVGVHIRVGNDPAGVGNWPQYPDFTTPGTGPISTIGQTGTSEVFDVYDTIQY